MTAEELCKVIVKGMEDKKASNIVLMDLRDIFSTMTDFCDLFSHIRHTGRWYFQRNRRRSL